MHRDALFSAALFVFLMTVLLLPSFVRGEEMPRRCPRSIAQRLGSRWGDDLGTCVRTKSPESSPAVAEKPVVRRRPVAPSVDDLSADQVVLHLRLVEHHMSQLEALRTAGRLSPSYTDRIDELRQRQELLHRRLSVIIAAEPSS